MKKIETKKIIFSLLIVVLFAFVFILLINKNESVNLGNREVDTFNYHTVYGKQLVVRDFNYVYPKYYVIYFSQNNNFDVHAFSYYTSREDYEYDYNLYINNILDYNAKDKMLRILYTRGIGDYDSVASNIGEILNSNNLRVYE